MEFYGPIFCTCYILLLLIILKIDIEYMYVCIYIYIIIFCQPVDMLSPVRDGGGSGRLCEQQKPHPLASALAHSHAAMLGCGKRSSAYQQ